MSDPDPRSPPPHGITGDLSRLYDVFVDWPGRLAREMPGIERHLRAVGARRVLDAGCGTGQHVKALRERGFEVHGADASPDMLARAAGLLGGPAGLHAWRLGEPPPLELHGCGPFDALICMGNVWPQLASEAEARAAAEGLRALVRPAGLVLLGLKAVAVRFVSRDPYLPLLRREHEGRPLWFVRFVELGLPALPDGARVAELHMVVVAGDTSAGPDGGEAMIHRVTRVRAWDPAGLAEWLANRGFEGVRVSGSLADPEVVPRGEDVFATMRLPGGRA